MDWFIPWYWLIAALGFVALELTLPALFFLSLSSGAALVGLLAFALPLPFALELLLFAVLSGVSLLLWRHYLGVREAKWRRPEAPLNRGAENLVGQTYVLEEAIEDGQGRVKVGDTVWLARGPDLAAGAKVLVVGVRGTALEVIPVSG